jgi:hypothetical protein
MRYWYVIRFLRLCVSVLASSDGWMDGLDTPLFLCAFGVFVFCLDLE